MNQGVFEKSRKYFKTTLIRKAWNNVEFDRERGFGNFGW